jgi:hypothetical protein
MSYVEFTATIPANTQSLLALAIDIKERLVSAGAVVGDVETEDESECAVHVDGDMMVWHVDSMPSSVCEDIDAFMPDDVFTNIIWS